MSLILAAAHGFLVGAPRGRAARLWAGAAEGAGGEGAHPGGDKPRYRKESAGGGDDKLTRDWKSGTALRQPRSRRNDPWWMREEEKTNPRILPIYKPWWLDNVLVDDTWKVADLKKEAARRGLEGETSGLKKPELVAALRKSSMDFDLSDKGFRDPVFRKAEPSALPTCYPEIYEGGPAQIEKLRQAGLSSMQAPAASK